MKFQKEIREHYQIDDQYIDLLYPLHVELVKLQKFISDQKIRLAILFEGRDAAGKGSAIHRFSQFLNPAHYRSVALGKPSEVQRGQWYFQRYVKELPNAGEIVFFDRSWYNRAVVEPVMGFCTEAQYKLFMEQVTQLETMLHRDGIHIVKYWFSIEKQTQAQRIEERLTSPLKQWKVSPVDLAATEKWEAFTDYKQRMFNHTNTIENPWLIIQSASREFGRIAAIYYLLQQFDYPEKSLPAFDYGMHIKKADNK